MFEKKLKIENKFNVESFIGHGSFLMKKYLFTLLGMIILNLTKF